MTTEGRKFTHVSNRHGSVGANQSVVRSEVESLDTGRMESEQRVPISQTSKSPIPRAAYDNRQNYSVSPKKNQTLDVKRGA